MKTPPQVGEKVFWYDRAGWKHKDIVTSSTNDGRVYLRSEKEYIHYRALAGRIKKKEQRVWWVRFYPNGTMADWTKLEPIKEKHLWVRVKECREVMEKKR